MEQVRVGIVGLGEVAQVVHLPVLQAMPHRYRVAAVCDVSPTVLEAVGARVPDASRHERAEDLLAADLDAVLVLSNDEYHADHVVAALDAGLHVLVEKPMCLTMSEAERIAAARDRSTGTVMVGYMRRFAPAFVDAIDQVAALGRVTYARVHDIIGPNRSFIDQSATVVRADDVPAALAEERARRAEELGLEATGDGSPELRRTYRLLAGLGSHDLSAMRELLGPPDGVIAARAWRGGTFVAALFARGDHVVTYETGVDDQLRFDAHLEVYGETGSVRVQYDTPYIRHLPTTLVTERTDGDAHTRRIVRPTYTDPYTYELEAFHRVVTQGVAPKTDVEDAIEDLRLFRQLIDAMRDHPIPS